MKRGFSLFFIFMSINLFSQVKVEFPVDGVCGMCKSRIEKAASEFEFVKSAEWNKELKILKLVVSSENDDIDAVQKRIAEVGHDTQKYKATDQAYEDLHMCCKYRDEELTNTDKYLHGMVFEKDSDGVKHPLAGVNVYWDKTVIGSVSGKKGSFLIEKTQKSNVLKFSFVGYEKGSVKVGDEDYVILVFDSNKMLDEVIVTYRSNPTINSFLKSFKVQELTTGELQKAACCSLSESFETNATVDALSTDAVTGTKQIELLGLSGTYAQILRENMPDARLLSAVQGLSFTPGTWIESIQLNTGSGSVVNGFEGFTGQINVELKKPTGDETLYVNAFSNVAGRVELNANSNISFSEDKRFSTGIFAHYSTLQKANDFNEDNFLDMPLYENIILMNRWNYQGEDGLHIQLGVKGVKTDKDFGSIEEVSDPNLSWSSSIDNEKFEIWSKVGKLLESGNNFGIQFSYTQHQLDSKFGNRLYNATQNSIYLNSIYQILFSESLSIKTGLSFYNDKMQEDFESIDYKRDEYIYGAFSELNYQATEKLSTIIGLRVDNHNNFGFFLTPRLNVKYSFSEKSVLRISAARAQKTASIFSENIGLLASSRAVLIENNNTSTPYALDAEVAWNYGINYSKGFENISFNLDYYFTNFENQVVVDLDKSTREINFYNLQKHSFSHSFLTQVDWKVFANFDLRLAYRFNDVQIDYKSGRMQKYLMSKNRAFFNIGYEITDSWKFDYTLNWFGRKRIPSTALNPSNYQLEQWSPSFTTMNVQVNKLFLNNDLDLYVGVENLLNFTQDNPIVAAGDPNGQYFDATLVWGPVFGRNIYFGVKYKI
jgi:hypothetical protein